jgi:hypothetical protein
MTIKILVMTSKEVPRIAISFDIMNSKRRTKTFKREDVKAALDYVCNEIDDKYVGTFDRNLRNWAIYNNHDIFRKKNLCFC